jgi:hypothetical protein
MPTKNKVGFSRKIRILRKKTYRAALKKGLKKPKRISRKIRHFLTRRSFSHVKKSKNNTRKLGGGFLGSLRDKLATSVQNVRSATSALGNAAISATTAVGNAASSVKNYDYKKATSNALNSVQNFDVRKAASNVGASVKKSLKSLANLDNYRKAIIAFKSK